MVRKQKNQFKQNQFIHQQCNKLLKWIKNKTKQQINIFTKTICRDFDFIDISINAKGNDQEKIYAENQQFQISIRKGNTIIKNLRDQIPFYFWARKGLPKIYELKPKYILYNTKQIKPSKINKTQKALIHSIFDQIAIKIQKKKIKLYITQKLNGENCQISYSNQINTWIICNGNISMMIDDQDSLKWPQYKFEKYNIVKMIAKKWLRQIKKYQQDRLQNLKDILNKNTFIGQYCGNQKLKRIIKYKRQQIIFFAIVPKYSQNKIYNLPIEECVQIFQQFQLKFVKYYFPSKICQTWKQLHQYLQLIQEQILTGTISQFGKGSVIYFQSIQQNKNKIISICKLQTLQFKLYDKMKQLLIQFAKKNGSKIDDFEIKEILQNFSYSSKQLTTEFNSQFPRKLGQYQLIFKKALTFISQKRIEETFIKEKFIYFMDLLHYSIFTDQPPQKNMLQNFLITKKLKDIDWCKYNFQQTKIIILPIGLPGMGKTYMFKQLKSILERQNYNNYIIESDIFQQIYINKKLQNKTLSFLDIYTSSKDLSKKKYFNQIQQNFKHNKHQGLIEFIMLDRVFVPKQFQQLKQQLQQLQIYKNYHLIALLPKCLYYADNNSYCFSVTFILMCIKRVLQRGNHTIFKGNDQQKLEIIFHYINEFRDFQERRTFSNQNKQSILYFKFSQDIEKYQMQQNQINKLINKILFTKSQQCKQKNKNKIVKELIVNLLKLIQKINIPYIKHQQFKYQCQNIIKMTHYKNIPYLNLQQLSNKNKIINNKNKKNIINMIIQINYQDYNKLINQIPNNIMNKSYVLIKKPYIQIVFCFNKDIDQLQQIQAYNNFQENKQLLIKVSKIIRVKEGLILCPIDQQKKLYDQFGQMQSDKKPYIILGQGDLPIKYIKNLMTKLSVSEQFKREGKSWIMLNKHKWQVQLFGLQNQFILKGITKIIYSKEIKK